jgi:hypothetical protein
MRDSTHQLVVRLRDALEIRDLALQERLKSVDVFQIELLAYVLALEFGPLCVKLLQIRLQLGLDGLGLNHLRVLRAKPDWVRL